MSEIDDDGHKGAKSGHYGRCNLAKEMLKPGFHIS